MRLRGGDVAPVERDVGGDVGRVARPPGARAEEGAVGQGREPVGAGEVADPPRAAGGAADGRREQRVARGGEVKGPLGPLVGLVHAAHVGELGQRRDQAQGEVDVALGEGVLERGPQVVDVRQRGLDPCALVDALHAARGRLGEADEVLGVPSLRCPSCRSLPYARRVSNIV